MARPPPVASAGTPNRITAGTPYAVAKIREFHSCDSSNDKSFGLNDNCSNDNSGGNTAGAPFRLDVAAIH